MYESEFGTDWDDLDKEGALERAFALGVARELGDPNPEEYERLRETAETTYRRSLIELSYDEGRRKAADRTATDDESVWEELVGSPETEVDAPEDADDRSGGPPGMTSRPEPSALPSDSLDRLRLPPFLRRR